MSDLPSLVAHDSLMFPSAALLACFEVLFCPQVLSWKYLSHDALSKRPGHVFVYGEDRAKGFRLSGVVFVPILPNF